MDIWIVYMLRCKDYSLYTGITKDLTRRMHQHSTGRGAKYTRAKGFLKLEFSMSVAGKGKALSIEYGIKKLKRSQKEEITKLGNINV